MKLINEIILIGNYLQQKKKHQASYAWVCDRQRLNLMRSINAFIIMSNRVSKEFGTSTTCLSESREGFIEVYIDN